MPDTKTTQLSKIPVGGHLCKKAKSGGPATSIYKVVSREGTSTVLKRVAPASYGDDLTATYEEDFDVYPVDSTGPVCVVRHFDKYDGYWFDCGKPMSLEEAHEKLEKKTEGGTRYTKYSDGAYYKIFPASTRMIFDGK